MSKLRCITTTLLGLTLMTMTGPLRAAETDEFHPETISEVDAINCHLDAPSYNGFAISISGDDGIAAQRNWHKIETGNPFLNEYELPQPIAVTGDYTTRRIAFSSSSILAILDLPDPGALAQAEGIANAADPTPLIDALVAEGKVSRAEAEAQITFRKFLGERVLVDVTEPAKDEGDFGTHTVIARSISNVSSHPGKTLYGCSYRIELLDRDGKPI